MSTLSFINEFPILRYKLDLGEYHPDLEGNSVEVWLNLSDDFQTRWRAFNADMAALIKAARAQAVQAAKTKADKARAREMPPGIDLTDALKQARVELFVELWDLSHADVTALFEESKAAGLRAWMRRRTWELIEEYATGRGEAGGG